MFVKKILIKVSIRCKIAKNTLTIQPILLYKIMQQENFISLFVRNVRMITSLILKIILVLVLLVTLTV